MLETPEELAALQDLLDASMAAAGPHLRDIITDERRLDARRSSRSACRACACSSWPP